MRSVVHFKPGGVEVLEILERPTPEPGPGELRIRIVVSGVNPTDIDARKSRAGKVQHFREPHVPGQDGAGIVDALGEGVRQFSVGDRVWVWDAAYRRHEGTSQEYLVIPAANAVSLADAVSFDVGASLGIPALTAHRALTSFADGPSQLEPGALEGKAVLVQGGTGAVGHAAVQLAKWADATVVTTVGDENKAVLARAAGADHVIVRGDDTRDRVHAVSPTGPDIIVEVSPRQNLPLDLSIIAPHGGISIYTPGGGEARIPSYQAMTKNVQVSFILTYTTSRRQKEAAVSAVNAAVTAGALGVGTSAGLPITRFPFEEAAAAHDAVEHHATGKVLIDISDPR